MSDKTWRDGWTIRNALFVQFTEQCVKNGFWLCCTTMAVFSLIMVRFDIFYFWHSQGNKPVVLGGLDPISVRPQTFLFASGGRMGIIWNTANRGAKKLSAGKLRGGGKISVQVSLLRGWGQNFSAQTFEGKPSFRASFPKRNPIFFFFHYFF